MTIELKTPVEVSLPEGVFLATRVTIALSQTVRVYGTLNGLSRVIRTNVWHETCDELPAEAIVQRLPTLHYQFREPGKAR